VFNTGYILFCKDFQFNNGDQSKDKYFIVLKRVEDKFIIGSLPTRKNKLPSFIDKPHGCVNKDDRCFNCYLFEANRPICNNGFCFDLPTFVYGDEIDTYEATVVDANYELGKTYSIEGQLKEEEFNSLISCITSSRSVKNKIRRELSK
jgi:hypothetical protein